MKEFIHEQRFILLCFLIGTGGMIAIPLLKLAEKSLVRGGMLADVAGAVVILAIFSVILSLLAAMIFILWQTLFYCVGIFHSLAKQEGSLAGAYFSKIMLMFFIYTVPLLLWAAYLSPES